MFATVRNSVQTAFKLATLPVLVFLFFRFYFHSILKVAIGYPFLTDYDFVFPTLIAFFFLVHLLESEDPLRLAFHRWGAAIAALSFGVFLVLGPALLPWRPVWFALAFCTIASSLFVWIRPSDFYRHTKSYLIWFAVLAAASKVVARFALDFLWEPAAQLTARMSCGVLAPFSSNLVCKYHDEQATGFYQMLMHPTFSVSIGLGCGGMEGVSFFVFVGLLILMASGENFGFKNSAKFLLYGAIGIFCMNVLRILIFFLVGIGVQYVKRAWGVDASGLLILFHNSIGWILYSAFLIAYVRYSKVGVAWASPARPDHRSAGSSLAPVP